MSLPEVGSGKVAIVPVFKGFRKTTDAEVTAATNSATGLFRTGFTKAGQEAGVGFSKSFSDSSGAGLKAMTEQVSKAAREVAAARLKEQDAAGKVRLAESQLAEARSRYASGASQVIRAEERLASAQRSQATVQSGLQNSTEKLASAKRTLADAADQASAAGGRLGGVFGGLPSVFGRAGSDSAFSFGSSFRSGIGTVFTGSFLANIATGAAREVGVLVGDVLKEGISFGFEGIGLASDLEQSVGAVQSVFKSQQGVILAAAKDAANGVGVSRSAYLKYATVVGAQLKNLGVPFDFVGDKTNALIGLSADLAAQFGGPTSQAIEAVSSLLRGERDPIERYGVSLKQVDIDARKAQLGLTGLTGEADKQADVTSTLALLWEQTADAQGRWAAEADTYAGKQQRLLAAFEDQKGRLGAALLPTATEVLTFANDDLLPILVDAIDESGPVLVDSIRDVLPDVKELVGKAADGLPGAIETALAASKFAVDLSVNFKPVGDFLGGLWQAVGPESPISPFQGIKNLGDFFGSFKTGVQDIQKQELGKQLLESLGAAGGAQAAGAGLATNFGTGLQSEWPTVRSTWDSQLGGLTDASTRDRSRGGAFGLGENFTEGLAEGILGKKGRATAAAKEVADAVTAAVGKGWEIASPSKSARRQGNYWGDGAALGIVDSKSKVTAASLDLSRAATFDPAPSTRSLEQILVDVQTRTLDNVPASSDRPIVADGSVIGWIRQLANGEATLVMKDYDQSRYQTLRGGRTR